MREDLGKKRFNLLRCPLNQQFHRSIREVSDITSDRKTLCKGLCGFPKVDSLNAAVENYFSGFEGGDGIFHEGGVGLAAEKMGGGGGFSAKKKLGMLTRSKYRFARGKSRG